MENDSTLIYLMKKSYLSVLIVFAVLLAGCSGLGQATAAADEDSVLIKGTQFVLDENGKRTFGQSYDIKSYKQVELVGCLSEKLIDAGYVFAIKVHVAEDCKLSQKEGEDFDIKLKEFSSISVYMPIGMERRTVDSLKAGAVVTIAYSPLKGPVLLLSDNPDGSAFLVVNRVTSQNEPSNSHIIDLMRGQDLELIICNYMKTQTGIYQKYIGVWAAEAERVVGQINSLRNVPDEIKNKVNAAHKKLKPVKATMSKLDDALGEELEEMNNDVALAVAMENQDLIRAHSLWVSHLLEIFRDQKAFSNTAPNP